MSFPFEAWIWSLWESNICSSELPAAETWNVLEASRVLGHLLGLVLRISSDGEALWSFGFVGRNFVSHGTGCCLALVSVLWAASKELSAGSWCLGEG